MQEKTGQITCAATNVKNTCVPSGKVGQKLKTRHALQIPILHLTVHSIVTGSRLFLRHRQPFHHILFQQEQQLVNFTEVFSPHNEMLYNHTLLHHSSKDFPIRNLSEFLHVTPASIDIAEFSKQPSI
jgi:hypothetical protein